MKQDPIVKPQSSQISSIPTTNSKQTSSIPTNQNISDRNVANLPSSLSDAGKSHQTTTNGDSLPAQTKLNDQNKTKDELPNSTSSSSQPQQNNLQINQPSVTTTDDKNANIQSYDNVQKSLEGFKKHTDLLTKELITIKVSIFDLKLYF